MIWIGAHIDQDTKLDALKAAKKVKTFFWDVHHQNDEKIPSFSTQWLTNSADEKNLVGLSMNNHAESPYGFHLQDGSFTEAFWYDNLEKAVVAYRPKGDDNETMEPEDCISNVIGMKILHSKMAGAPNLIDIKLRGKKEEEEELNMPPILYMYTLDGFLRMYQVFYAPWKNQDTLHASTEVKQAPSALNQLQPNSLLNQMQPREVSLNSQDEAARKAKLEAERRAQEEAARKAQLESVRKA